MANKGYYGKGAKTFGNPDGAVSGGGAYGAGGDNPDGPDQGGGGPPPPASSWTSCTTVNIVSTGLYGGGDDGYWVQSTYGLATGCPGAMDSTFGPLPGATIAGAPVVALAFTSADWLGNPAIIVAVQGAIPQNSFTSVKFQTNADATPEIYASASAQAFSQANPPGYTVWSFAPLNTFQFAFGPDPLPVVLV
jgi:hypothetical protein